MGYSSRSPVLRSFQVGLRSSMGGERKKGIVNSRNTLAASPPVVINLLHNEKIPKAMRLHLPVFLSISLTMFSGQGLPLCSHEFVDESHLIFHKRKGCDQRRIPLYWGFLCNGASCGIVVNNLITSLFKS